VDFPGPELQTALQRRLVDDHAAGVVLFQKNVVSATQVAALTAALRAVRPDAPPLISIDHEGGAVTRFPAAPLGQGPAMTALPSAMALGAAGDPGLARQAGEVAGRELRALGIDLNFAPVLDVNNNPANPVIGVRAFGETPGLVEAMGLAYIEGLQASGVAATAKHFPGHGDVTVDSHLGLPEVTHDLAHLEAVELVPFGAAVRAGVAAVMTAHIVYRRLDPSGMPATMSAPILSGLLRGHLGFRGVVITDSLSMRAIADHFGAGEAAVAAVRAGCDVVLALGPEALQREVLERLADAIEQGAIPAARVSEATARLAAMTARQVATAVLQTADGGRATTLAEALGTSDHRAVAQRIADAAVTLVRDQQRAIPLRGPRVGVVAIADAAASAELVEPLRRRGADARACAPDDLSGVDHVVAVTCSRGTMDQTRATTVQDLHRRVGGRLVVVAIGDPYDLLQFPRVPAYVATYGADPCSLDAAARVLLGQLIPSGRLPVTLPGLHPQGTGGAR
jgi:beta-N-acetylhexosaminidase